jgi:RimJ/RimL family protein N-acetyltransferase
MPHDRPPLPVLSDGRVVLRALEHGDVPALEAGMHDPAVTRWIGPAELTGSEVLAQAEERWADGSPTFATCDPDGTFAGKAWLHVPEDDPSTGFVGYWLLPAARGRGLATAAVRLIVAWAVRELGITTVRLTADPENGASHRVAERAGFGRVGIENGQVVFALDGAPLSPEGDTGPSR